MKPKEPIEVRRKMAEMHDDVLKRINTAYKNKQHIEVCWLCYACFESRVNRIFEKICVGCSKGKRTDGRHVGINTKIECCARLIRNGYAPLQKENVDLVNTVKGWCKERNSLIHSLVSIETYDETDKKFESLAKRGKKLVEQMYSVGKDVREYYYNVDDIPVFDQAVVNKCKLATKCIKDD